MALAGWHRGENAIHQRLNTFMDYAVSQLYTHISGDLPEEHALFHSTRLPFLPVTTLDNAGRPWGSILAGKDGELGFVQAPRYSVLTVDAQLWDGEPLQETSELFEEDGKMLVAGIGIEFSTRRRNKFAGSITQLKRADDRILLDFNVNQAVGNCPKYINIRDLIPHPNTSPRIAYQERHLAPEKRLPDEVIKLITDSDTVFLGTSYRAYMKDSMLFPSHLGMNHRGGRPGFIRVVPSDGRTVVLPDFSGNRFMTSLGNIEATPLASLTFIDFVSGDILYLTGDAENLVGADALKLMPFQSTLTTVYITGYTLVRDALPLRQRPGTSPERSPYSPPVRLLAEEAAPSTLFDKSTHPTALLARIDLHSGSIATFTWESSVDLRIKPGQAIIMDMSPLVGVPAYRHMAPGKPTSLNDDSIRTWTVSSAHGGDAGTRTYALTMRQKPGGAVTVPLFTIARKLAELHPEALADSRPLQLKVGIVGVTGDFVLAESDAVQPLSDGDLGLTVPLAVPAQAAAKKLLWVAGGIGLTPFLSMLKALSLPSTISGSTGNTTFPAWDIRLVLATAEPDVLVPLVVNAFTAGHTRPANLRLTLEIFTKQEYSMRETYDGLVAHTHKGRLPGDFFVAEAGELQERAVFLCGSPEFEKAALDALAKGGVPESAVKREGFEY